MAQARSRRLDPELREALARLRARRRFVAADYAAAKVSLLDGYLRASGLRGCVVGVSGGIDSAVVLGLVCRAAALPGSPLGRVVAALMPMFVPEGATHQDSALARGAEVARVFGAAAAVVDLSAGHGAVRAGVEAGLGARGGPWAAGQLVSYLRTPALYYLTSLLSEQGYPAFLAGTTNRDEGSFLGFFGKASDGMVDVQLVSDLHKSEIRALADFLGVPPAVRDAVPSGDTFDGAPDEEMIGAPYDFVELYTGLLALGDEARTRRLVAGWSPGAREQFAAWSASLEALHRHNAHKYAAGSPAVHLDLLERAVPRGWSEGAPSAFSMPAAGGAPGSPAPRFVGESSLSPGLVAATDSRRLRGRGPRGGEPDRPRRGSC